MTRLISTKEAARLLGVSKAFLERDRWAGAKIPFVTVGSRAVRYDVGDLEKYIAAQRRRDEEDLDEDMDEDIDDDLGDEDADEDDDAEDDELEDEDDE
jgi:hypothetical protein